jgi:diguanylate cyclase (GGDEF)-like protein
MLPLFSFLHHYSFSREALEDCRENILKSNIRSLMVISMLTGILLVTFAVVHFAINKEKDGFASLLASSLLEFLIFIYANHLIRTEKYAARFFYSGFVFFILTALLFGIYTDVVIRREESSANFMVLLLCFQTVFHIRALYKLLLIIGMACVFSASVIMLKPPEFWYTDVLEMITAVLVSAVLSWYMSYATIKEMLVTGKLLKDRDRFREESVRDELTGLANRREYQNAVRFYVNANHRVRQTVCAIMLDVDFFKNYNDYYGHQKGDEVLKAIGGVLKRVIKEEKVFAARVGGEEFIVLWTENRTAEAERVAIKLLNMIVDLRIPHARSSAAPYVTASFGLYILRGGSSDTEEDLYREADYALYEAKAWGRNCIMLRDSADMRVKKVEVVSQEKNLGRRAAPPNREKE